MHLEKFTENDKQLYTQLVFNEAIMQMNYGRVFTEEEAQMIFQWMVKQNESDSQFGDYKVFAGEEEAQYIGMGAILWNEEEEVAEVEYMILPELWNRGYGTALIEKLLALLDEGTKVNAITDPANIGSQRILQKNGFTFVKQDVNTEGAPVSLYQKTVNTDTKNGGTR